MTLAFVLTTIGTTAQTLNVQQGSVTYAFTANGDDMNYTDDGQTLTIGGRSFAVSDITRITVDATSVTQNTVSISYDGTSANVVIPGNVASYVTATVSGAHVAISQTNTDDVDGKEITYVMSGSSTDGGLTLDGSYKCSIQLEGVTLTNPSGAAISISNKKRIEISAKNGTVNSLTDGAAGSQTGCIYSKGQLQFQGKGTLNVSGMKKHAIKCGDYVTVKNLTLNITSAVNDGISCNKYFAMESGQLTISGVGDDGIQADYESDDDKTGMTTKHEDENSSNAYIEDGTLTITTTANGTKCIKSENTVYVNGGTLTLNASGNVDTSDSSDPSYVAAIGCEKFVQNGGTITLNVKGAAGRGIKATDIETNGGELSINNAATPTTLSSDVKGAKGLKATNIALNAGTISITMTGNASKAIRCGDGTQSTSGGGGGGGWGGWGGPGGGGPGGGGMGGRTTWTNITGSYTQGKADGTGPTLTVSQTGGTYSSSSAKGIKAICAVTIYGGETVVNTTKSGGEGLESKTSVDIRGGKHYLKCYDDCINSAGKIFFNGGVTVCYSNGNDAIDSNAGTSGAVTIGNGCVFAYMTKGDPDEGLDCDNNNYIQITGTGIGISAGGKQSSASGTISGAKQGYAFLSKPSSYAAKTYYTLADAQGNNLVTYSFEAAVKNSLSLITATGMTSKGSYTIKSSTTAPTDAATAWHGLYLGSTAAGTTSVTNFTAQ